MKASDLGPLEELDPGKFLNLLYEEGWTSAPFFFNKRFLSPENLNEAQGANRGKDTGIVQHQQGVDI